MGLLALEEMSEATVSKGVCKGRNSKKITRGNRYANSFCFVCHRSHFYKPHCWAHNLKCSFVQVLHLIAAFELYTRQRRRGLEDTFFVKRYSGFACSYLDVSDSTGVHIPSIARACNMSTIYDSLFEESLSTVATTHYG